MTGCPGLGTVGCVNTWTDVEAERDGLARRIAELNVEVAAAWNRYQAVYARRGAVIERYNALVGQVRMRRGTPTPEPRPAAQAPPAQVPPAEAPAGEVRPGRPESSSRTVQNLLFVLG